MTTLGAAAPSRRGEAVSLARDSGRTVVGTVVSNLANVLVIVLLARTLGAAAVGEYALGFAARAVLLLLCGLGMRPTMTRFVAALKARGDHDGVRGAVAGGVGSAVACAVLAAAGWVALAPWLAAVVFGGSIQADTLRVFACSLPFLVLMEIALAATRGFSTMRASTWIGLVLEPGSRALLTAAVLLAGGGVLGASYALLAASALSGVAAWVVLRRMLADLDGSGRAVPARELIAFAAPSWIATLATQGLLWADVLILGALASASDVGAYQVAARVVLVAMLVITPLGMAMAPRAAHDWELGDREGVTRRYVDVVAWSGRLTWPLLAGAVAVPMAVLELFGPGFPGAREVVVILAIGAAAEAIGAPGAVLLNQIGRNRFNMVLNSVLLVANVGLNLVLIPVLGIEGSALAWATTMIVGAVVRVVAVRRMATHRWPVDVRLALTLGGALLAALVARLVVAPLPDPPLVQIVAAGLVVLAVYGAVLVAAGLSPAERAALVRWLDLRVPAVRRLRSRWELRDAHPGTEPVAIAELVAPYRYDVLLRAELFRLAEAEPELARSHPRAFARMARRGGYGTWFDDIVRARGDVRTASEDEADQVFATIVATSLGLQRRAREHGRAALGPVTVVRLPAGTEIDGCRIDEDRYAVLDGGHRLALAIVEGATHLAPGEYVVVEGRRPRNNTALLLGSARVDAEEVRSFLAAGSAQR